MSEPTSRTLASRIIVFAGFVAIIAQLARAEVRQYSDLPGFLAATGNPQHVVDFEIFGDGTPVVGSPVISGAEWSNLGVMFRAVDATGVPQIGDTAASVNWTASSPTHIFYTKSEGNQDISSCEVEFIAPVRSVAFVLIDSEYDSGFEEISLLDSAGQTLMTLPFPIYGSPTGGLESNYFLGFHSDTPIAKVVLLEGLDSDSVGLDDLMFTVPEPATLTLLALGGLALMRRRHSR